MCRKDRIFAQNFEDCAMESVPSFNSYIEQSIISNWEKDALTDYKGATLQYHDVARKIEKLHILFENGGVEAGDKVAICGRNSAQWAVAFLATITYGAVIVPIQHEFTPEQIYNIVNHSDAKLLFVGDIVAPTIEVAEMPQLEGVICLADNSLMESHSEKLTYAREHLNEIYGLRYPKFFRKEHVSYHVDKADELAMINYTSGTTGFSKGVMIPYRALWSNIDYLCGAIGIHIPKDSNCLCILPMAHMYGLTCEFLLQFTLGSHLFFLTRQPSPSLIQEACVEVKPAILVSVPLVVEKIIRKKVFPELDSRYKILMSMPVIGKKIRSVLCQRIKDLFGGQIYEIIVGGASLSKEIEHFLRDIGFPITVGYGTTETAPMISFSDYTDFEPRSCGTPAKHMEVKIKSDDPENVLGEIWTRGLNVMQGYYKNAQATEAVIDEEGWFHTGDLATMSADGHIFIRGRIKNMLLGSNGQNVYPEEIEDKLNSMAMVSESLVLQRGDELVALVYPDMEEAHQMDFSEEDLVNVMTQNRLELNQILPSFCKIAEIQLHGEEFVKTPKKSIKRYLYQDAVKKEK